MNTTQDKIVRIEKQLMKAKDDNQVKLLLKITLLYMYQTPKKALLSCQKLEKLLKNKPDSQDKVKMLRLFGDTYLDLGNNKKSGQYFQEALLMAKKIKSHAQLGNIFNSMGNLKSTAGMPEKAEELFKKSMQIKTELNDKKGQADVHNNLGNLYWEKGEYKKSLKHHKLGLSIRKKLGNKRDIAGSLSNIGNVYEHMGDLNKSIEYQREALKVRREINDKRGISISLNNMGLIYWKWAKYDEAIKYFLESVKIDEALGSKRGVGIGYHNLGLIKAQLKKNDEALVYSLKALKIFREIDFKNAIAASLDNIGLLYRMKGDYKKSLKYHNEALKIQLNIKNKRGYAKAYVNLGLVYKKLKQFSKSEELFIKALKIQRTLGNKRSIAKSFTNLAGLNVSRGNYKKTFFYLNKAIKLAEEVKDNQLISIIYKGFSDSFRDKKRYKEAYEYYKKYVNVKDEVFNKESNDKVVELEKKYLSEKKDKEIIMLSNNNLLLEKDNQIKKLKIIQQNFKTKMFIIGFIAIFIVFIFLLLKYRKLFVFWKKKNYISSYRLINKIGSGGMAVVFKAFHVKNKNKVIAIKILRADMDMDINQKDRFLNEAHILKNIYHDNIVKIFEIGEHNNQLFIAMEYISGNTLFYEIYNNRKLLIKYNIDIIKQLINALTEIHKKGVIHRDLKPENIMLTEKDGRFIVKLLDFGLAKTQSLNSLTKTGMVLGTIYYMPPEQLFHSAFSFAGDIYSLGIIFYEMMTGEKPFQGETTGEIMFEIMNKKPEPILQKVPDIDEKINEVIFQMINKKPQNRPDIISLKKLFKQFN